MLNKKLQQREQLRYHFLREVHAGRERLAGDRIGVNLFRPEPYAHRTGKTAFLYGAFYVVVVAKFAPRETASRSLQINLLCHPLPPHTAASTNGDAG